MKELTFEELLQVAGGLDWQKGETSCNVEVEGQSWWAHAWDQIQIGCSPF